VPLLLAAACGGGSDGTSGPPSLGGSLVVAFSGAQANPGDGVAFTVTLPTGVAAGSLLLIQLSFDGQGGPVDTVTVPPNYGALQGSINVPDGFPDGTLMLMASLPAYSEQASASLQIQDTQPPTLQDAGMNSTGVPFPVDMTPGAPMLLVGGTDTVFMYASDNGGLAWLGFSLSGPANIRDSVAVSGLTDSLVVPIQIPSSWLGGTPDFVVFGRDRDNNVTVQDLGMAAVAAHISRPVRTLPLDTSVRSGVYDSKRNVVYLAVGDQPMIQVLSLASMTYAAPLAIPTPAADLDVRPGGDSLVVALAKTGDLAIINLISGSPATVVHLSSLNGPQGDTGNVVDSVQGVRVAGDGRIIVVGVGTQVPSDAPTSGLVQFDPSTGRDSALSLGIQGKIDLTRTGDGSKVLIVNWLPAVYDARAHAYSTSSSGIGAPWGGGGAGGYARLSSADQTGSYFAVADQIFDSTFSDLGIADLADADANFPPSLIAADGAQFYVSATYSIGDNAFPYYIRFKVPFALNPRLSTMIGVPLDVVDTPEPIQRFVAITDTTSLLAFGADKAMLFDLTQSSPSTMSRVRLARSARRRPHRRSAANAAAVLHLHIGAQGFTVPFVVPRGHGDTDRQAHTRN
jgi:hypothetical protein